MQILTSPNKCLLLQLWSCDFNHDLLTSQGNGQPSFKVLLQSENFSKTGFLRFWQAHISWMFYSIFVDFSILTRKVPQLSGPWKSQSVCTENIVSRACECSSFQSCSVYRFIELLRVCFRAPWTFLSISMKSIRFDKIEVGGVNNTLIRHGIYSMYDCIKI